MCDHWLQQQGTPHPDAILVPDFPHEMAYLWEVFCKLDTTRGVTMAGPAPLLYSEILAWKTLTQKNLRPRDVEALMKLDRTYLEALRD